MTLFGYSSFPNYPDRYNRNKKWVKVLPIPGRPIQTAEFTEIQSIVQDNLKQGMNTLFKNGSVVSGLRISISSLSLNSINLSISSGQLYVEGIILEVEEGRLSVPLTGEYTIGVLVEERIITETDDGSLRDPALGGDSYGTEGAARLIWNTSIVVDGFDAFAIGKVNNGIISQTDLNPFYQIEKILSQYTYERSGHFCVSGYDITSLGINRRGVADSNKYTALQGALNNAASEQQTILAKAITAKDNIISLTAQLESARALASTSPTTINLARQADLQIRVNNAEINYDNLSSLLVEKDVVLQSAQTSLTSSNDLLLDREEFSITPGIAYIEGHRVAKSNPNVLTIPRDLPQSSVDSATFSYQGVAASSTRTFSTNTSTSIVAINANEYINLTFTFSDLTTNNTVPPNIINLLGSKFSLSFTTKISNNISLSNLLNNIINNYNSNLNNGETKIKLIREGGSEVTTNTGGGVITDEVKKEIIKKYIKLVKAEGNIIVASSLILGEETNVINWVIESNKLNATTNQVVGGATGINIDIPNAFLSGGQSSTTFQLGLRPVAEINKLVATLSEESKPFIRGVVPGTNELLGDDSVTKITRVQQGTVTYTEGVDYRLIDQSRIDWSLNGVEPSGGTTYFISFEYTQSLGINEDFILDRGNDSIRFTGRTPTINTVFTVDYSYYLAKAGVITLDKDGKFSYILSNASSIPIPPSVPNTLLGISAFKFYANSTEIVPLNCRRQTVEDLQDLATRVRNNTKNTEILKLDLEAIKYINQEVTEPIGSFNDALQDLSKIDFEQTTGSIVPTVQALSAGYYAIDTPTTYISGGNIYTNELNKTSYITLPYTSVKLLEQPRSTKTRPVAPIISSIKKRGNLYLSDSYIFDNAEYKGITPCDNLSNTLNSLTLQLSNSPIVKSIISSVNNLIAPTAFKVVDSLQSGNAVSLTNNDNDSYINKIYNLVKANKFKQIELRAENLTPSSHGFRLYFSGKEILGDKYQLLNSTSPSPTPAGTIKSKADGTISLRFNIPEDTICGVHTVELISSSGYCKARVSIYNNLLNQICFSALKTWSNQSVSTTASSFLPLEYTDSISEDLLRLGINNSQPDAVNSLSSNSSQIYPIRRKQLYQTFTSPDLVYLTQINLKLKSGPTNGIVKVYLTSADDLPDKTIYGIAYPQSISYSPFASDYTTFVLQSPVIIERGEKYGIGVESIGGAYNFYTARLGEKDLITNNILGEQLYLEGNLYTSTDGVSISLYDREDLTYKLNRAEFNKAPVVVDLGIYSQFSNVTYFCLNSRDVVPVGTDIIYEYATCITDTSCSTFKTFKPNTVVCLGGPTAKIKLRATLVSNSSLVSPALHINGSTVSMYSANSNNFIVSKTVNYPEPYKNVKSIIRYIAPSNTSIQMYYSPTRGFSWEGSEWKELALLPNSTRLIDSTLNLYESTYAINEPTIHYTMLLERQRFRYRVKLSTTNIAIQPTVLSVITYVY